ncbi:MAG: hypothetical protein ACE5PM_08975 [Candidatus Hydrothermarchaeales archaeon]
MSGVDIDHIMATIMALNFIFLGVMLQSMFFPTFLYHDQLEMREKADGALLHMLGLLSADGTLDYELDPKKVSMLNEDNPFDQFSYGDLLDQLGLEGYDFQLRISSPIDVEVTRIGSSWSQPEFLVKVADGGMPLSDVLVEATIIYIKEEGEVYVTYSTLAQAEYTSTLGEVVLDKINIPGDAEDYVVLFHIDTGEIDTYLVCYDIDSGLILETHYFDGKVWIRLSEQPQQGAVRIQNLVGLVGSDIVPLYNSSGGDEDKLMWSTGENGWWNRSLGGMEDVSMVFVTSKSVGRGWLEVGFSFMPLLIGESGITFGDDSSGQKTIVSKTMVISNKLYKLDFLVWRIK